MTPEIVLNLNSQLGEGPLWDEREQVLWWVDIKAGHLYRYDPATGENRTFEMGRQIGTVGLTNGHQLIVALEDGIALFDPHTESLDLKVDPEADKPGNRFNEGKPGPDGSMIVGTMADPIVADAGALYQYFPDGRIETIAAPVTISNGLAWTTDQRTMYYIDTPTRCVDRFDVDPTTGTISDRRTAFLLPANGGGPDGMTIDAEDKLWIAFFGGGAVRRFDPQSGAELAHIDLPTDNITSCVFGGPQLDTLYMTSAAIGLSAAQRAAQPAAGALFRVKTDVQGRAAFRFGQ